MAPGNPSWIATAKIWLCGFCVSVPAALLVGGGFAKQRVDRTGAVPDDRRRLDERQRLSQKLEVQAGRVRGAGVPIGPVLVDRTEHLPRR